jgi:hypothetical protein
MCTFLAIPQPFFQTGNYLLCKGRDHSSLRRSDLRCSPLPCFHHPGLQPLPQQLQHPPVTHSPPYQCEQEIVIDRIKIPLDVGVYYPPTSQQHFVDCADCLRRTAPRSKPVRLILEVRLEDWLNYYPTRLLDDSVSPGAADGHPAWECIPAAPAGVGTFLPSVPPRLPQETMPRLVAPPLPGSRHRRRHCLRWLSLLAKPATVHRAGICGHRVRGTFAPDTFWPPGIA